MNESPTYFNVNNAAQLAIMLCHTVIVSEWWKAQCYTWVYVMETRKTKEMQRERKKDLMMLLKRTWLCLHPVSQHSEHIHKQNQLMLCAHIKKNILLNTLPSPPLCFKWMLWFTDLLTKIIFFWDKQTSCFTFLKEVIQWAILLFSFAMIITVALHS